MQDSRLKVAASLLDDARALLIDIVDEGPNETASVKDFNSIDAGRQFINSARVYIQAADSTQPDGAA